MMSVDLHPEGMSYSPGDGCSRVALLFESPGINEILMNAPLSGRTGMRYCQIVRKLRERSECGSIGELRWDEFCKNNATVVNVYPFYSSLTHDAKVRYVQNPECVDSVWRCINLERIKVLICFGEPACSLYEKLKGKNDFKIPTVLKAWHISSSNSHCTDGTQHDKSNPLWVWQLDLLTKFIVRFSVKEGVFGWDQIRTLDNKCEWYHKNKKQRYPEWMKGEESCIGHSVAIDR